MRNYTVKKFIALGLKVSLTVVIFAFLTSESLNFFEFVFPADQWYMSYAGLGLTSGAVLVYLYLFLFDTETDLQKTVSLIMVLLSIVGELLTAGFGMQVGAWEKSGFQMQESDFAFMVLAVRILMFVHAIAMVFYFAGDKVIAVFDEDGNGVPDFMEKTKKPLGFVRHEADTQLITALQKEVADLKAKNPQTGQSEK